MLDARTGAYVHTGRVSAVLELAVVVEGPRGTAWHFARVDGRGLGAVADLRLQGGAWR